jgi:branched-chain amino acid transport system ATP-binding protein/neutral amino acid transport system ATP-binding protein
MSRQTSPRPGPAPIAPLVVEALRAGYGAGDILKGIDLTVTPETVFTVVGPNGSGKSTLIKTLAGLVPARQGRIALCGRDITRLPAARRVSAGVAYVPQEHNVFRNLTVGENLKLSTEFLDGERVAGPEQRERVLALFPDVAERLSLLAGNLSGGQRQMLAFACALMSNPEVLLLDEPSAGLSPKFVQQIFEAVLTVRDSGVTVFMIEQNVAAALPFSDTALVLVAGQVRLVTPAARLLAEHDLHSLYLGEA